MDPDCSLDKMKEIVDKALSELGEGRIMRIMARRQIPKLERWRARP